jgi:peptidoglycan/xylan/chitin deacetylase (PgdA/CDA1 family)
MGRIQILIISLMFITGPFLLIQNDIEGIEQDLPTRDLSDFSVNICDWRYNRSGAVSLTYDDGLSSQAHIAAPLMTERDIVGTFFITTSHCGIPYGANWSDWQNISDIGHEVSSHTIDHPDLETCTPAELWDEVVLSKKIIEDNLTGVDCETFSYPMGSYNSTVLQMVTENYLFARCDDHNLTADPKPEEKIPENLYSVVPCNFGALESYSHMYYLINETLDSEGWLVEMIHAIDGGGWDPVPRDSLERHLDLLVSLKEDLWIDTFVNVSKYIREREHTQVEIDLLDNRYLNISLNSDLSSEHDIPLTLEITIPGDWDNFMISGDDEFEVLSEETGGPVTRIFLELVPNTEILITRINEPPSTPQFISLIDDHDLTPVFSWSSSSDPDGDNITYQVAVQRNGSIIWYSTTSNTSIECDEVLDFNLNYTLKMNATDEFNATSSNFYYDFKLTNSPPQVPDWIIVSDLHSLSQNITWQEPFDPDGDNVTTSYEFTTFTEAGPYVESGVLTSNKITITYPDENGTSNLWFEETQIFELEIIDEFGYSSGKVSTTFQPLNDPPEDVSGVDVTYLNSRGPRISFDHSMDRDGDQVRYLINIDRLGEYPESYEYSVYSIETRNTTIDLPEVLNENNYRVSITAIDSLNMVSNTSYRDFTIDLSPQSPTDLLVASQDDFEGGIYVAWNYPYELRDMISGFYVHIFDEDPENNTEALPMRSLDVWNNLETWVGDLEYFKEYWVSFTAYDGEGRNSSMDEYLKVIPMDTLAPLKVGGLTATDWNIPPGCRVAWQMAHTDDLAGFLIYRIEGHPPPSVVLLEPIHTIMVGNLSGTSWVDTSVEANKTYRYTVISVDNFGNKITTGTTWVTYETIPDEITEDPDYQLDVPKEENGFEPLLVPCLFLMVCILVLIIGILVLRMRTEDDITDIEE